MLIWISGSTYTLLLSVILCTLSVQRNRNGIYWYSFASKFLLREDENVLNFISGNILMILVSVSSITTDANYKNAGY